MVPLAIRLRNRIKKKDAHAIVPLNSDVTSNASEGDSTARITVSINLIHELHPKSEQPSIENPSPSSCIQGLIRTKSCDPRVSRWLEEVKSRATLPRLPCASLAVRPKQALRLLEGLLEANHDAGVTAQRYSRDEAIRKHSRFNFSSVCYTASARKRRPLTFPQLCYYVPDISVGSIYRGCW